MKGNQMQVVRLMIAGAAVAAVSAAVAESEPRPLADCVDPMIGAITLSGCGGQLDALRRSPLAKSLGCRRDGTLGRALHLP